MQTALVASRYRIIRELGRGGMGVVYLVEHVHTGDHLALKLLLGHAAESAQVVERFKREARASARIKSEHVVRVVDADVAPELGGAPFLVMELLDGCDLEKLVEQRGRLAAAEVVELLAQAARALDKSHAMGIVHRDLKPENLFLHRRENGTTILKVVDFGISKFVGNEAGDIARAGMTQTGAVMGTPYYMSPEQARGKVSLIGPTTDVWAMGIIAIHLLTGDVYWRAETVAELMAQILAEPLYRPSERWPWLPRALDDWFARSCARDPAHRFATSGEQVAALAAALGIAGEPASRERGASFEPAAFAPTAVASSARALAGARTTTSPLAHERPAPRAASSSWRWMAAGGALVALAGGAGVIALAAARYAPSARSAAESRASVSASVAAAPVVSSVAAPADPPHAPSADPPDATPTTPADAGARPAVRAPSPSPPRSPAPTAVGPAPPSKPYEPSAL